MSVSSKEWIEASQLVELNEQVISHSTVESWNIGTAKRMTANTKLKQHIDWTLNFVVYRSVVTSPESSEFLTAKEEASGENKRTSLIVVSSQ